MQLNDFLLTGLAVFSEALGTITGFGSSTFFVPIGVMLESFQLILALTSILHIFGNISKLILFRDKRNFRQLLYFALPSVVLCGVGALLTRYVDVRIFKIVLGVVLIGVSILFLTKTQRRALPRWIGIAMTGVSGFVTGLVGTGGAIRAVALSALNLEKNAFVLLSAGIDLGGDLLRFVVYTAEGYMDWSHWFYFPLLAAAGWIGSWIGKRILVYIPQENFNRIVALMILVSGVLLLY